MIDGIPVLDSHMHYAYPIREDSLIDVIKETHVDYAALSALPGGPRLDPTPDILAIKARYPARLFAFGCLDCTDYHKPRAGFSRRMIARVNRMMEAGCDGLKLLEGKPTMRRAYAIPDFDVHVWEPFWEFAEEIQLPILWHVNDPASFWDETRASAHAREQGWLYGETDVKDSEQFRQVRAVLERHERLNVCFAHCFFLAAQLPRLTEWMDRFPHMRVDLTPGIELYQELSETPEETLAFIEHFSSRILYGTDTGGRAALAGAKEINRQEALRRAEITRAFLTDKGAAGIRADGDYLVGTEPFVLRGMGLPAGILEQIFYRNFLRFVGRDTPREINIDKAKRLLRQTERSIKTDAKRRHAVPDLNGTQRALDIFTILEGNEE